MEAKKPAKKITKPEVQEQKSEKPAASADEKLAVLTIGGTQHLVTEGAHVTVPNLKIKEGEKNRVEVLLLVPSITEGTLTYKVLEHKKGPKVVSAKYKAKSRYRKRVGFRASLSDIVVEKIEAGK